MAQQGKKKDKGTRNGDRRNGKAWKKHPKPMGPRKRTEARQDRDLQIEVIRQAKYAQNKQRREEEARLAAELAEQVATEVAQKEAEKRARIAAVVPLKKASRAHVVA